MENEEENERGWTGMSHFDIDKYAYLNSILHRFDPRAKLISIFILIISIALINDIFVLSIGFVIVLCLVYISNIPLLFILKRLRWVAIFVLMILLILPFTIPGQKIVSMGSLTVTREGILRAVIITVKAFSIVLLIFPMLATMKFVTFIKALDKLEIPSKLVQIIALTYRYIFVLMNEIKRTFRSVEARGFRKKSGLYGIRTTAKITGMLLVRSYERSEKVYQAMLSRGYDGKMKTLKYFKMKRKDWELTFLIVGLAALLQVASLINIFNWGAA